MTNVGENADKLEPSYAVAVNVKWLPPFWKRVGQFLKKLNIATVRPSKNTLKYTHREMKTCLQRNLYMNILAELFLIA